MKVATKLRRFSNHQLRGFLLQPSRSPKERYTPLIGSATGTNFLIPRSQLRDGKCHGGNPNASSSPVEFFDRLIKGDGKGESFSLAFWRRIYASLCSAPSVEIEPRLSCLQAKAESQDWRRQRYGLRAWDPDRARGR